MIRLSGAEPVTPGMRVIHEHPVFRVKYFTDQQQKPFLRQTAHVQSGFTGKRDFQLFLQIFLFESDLRTYFFT